MRPRRGETGRSRAYRLPCLGTRERDLDVRYNEGGTLDESDDERDAVDTFEVSVVICAEVQPCCFDGLTGEAKDDYA